MQLTRRKILAGIATSGAGIYAYQKQNQEGALAGGSVDSNLRLVDYTKLSGGIAINNEERYGTLGICLQKDGNEKYGVTSRHIIDENFCEGLAEDLEGSVINQVDDREIGKVDSASQTGGIKSSDWAIIELNNADMWTNSIIGFNEIGQPKEVNDGDRIVMAGYNTGLVGGIVRNTGITAKKNGCFIRNLISFKIDGNVNTAGNSGAIVGKIDSGVFHPIGIHSFSSGDENKRFAIDIHTVLEQSNTSIVTDSVTYGRPKQSFKQVEATVVDKGNNVIISNLSDLEVSTILRIYNSDNKVKSEQSLGLGKYETTMQNITISNNEYLEVDGKKRQIYLEL